MKDNHQTERGGLRSRYVFPEKGEDTDGTRWVYRPGSPPEPQITRVPLSPRPYPVFGGLPSSRNLSLVSPKRALSPRSPSTPLSSLRLGRRPDPRHSRRPGPPSRGYLTRCRVGSVPLWVFSPDPTVGIALVRPSGGVGVEFDTEFRTRGPRTRTHTHFRRDERRTGRGRGDRRTG